MRFRQLGKTGLKISVFSLGSKGLSPSGENGENGRRKETSIHAVHRALELGITHIDTAQCYAGSEALLGEALEGVDRSKLHLTTRIEPCESADEMRRRIELSLSRLRVPAIDMLSIHGLNSPERLNLVTSPNGCMAGVEKAKEEGLVRHIGFSTHGPIDFIIRVLHSELFEFVQIHYGYFNQRNLIVLEKAHEMNIGVQIFSPVELGGRLQKAPASVHEMCEPLHPIVVNDRFILQHPAVSTINIGARRPEELAAHEPAFDNDGPLTDAETLALARMDVRRLQLPGTWCTNCHQCLPCPENIVIPEILRLRNMSLAYDMKEYARYRYRWLEGGGHWYPGRHGNRCTECGDCLPRCPERLDIPKLLRETDSLLRANGFKPIKAAAENC